MATRMATELLDCGIYVIGFSYPVVPKGQARIRWEGEREWEGERGGKREGKREGEGRGGRVQA